MFKFQFFQTIGAEAIAAKTLAGRRTRAGCETGRAERARERNKKKKKKKGNMVQKCLMLASAVPRKCSPGTTRIPEPRRKWRRKKKKKSRKSPYSRNWPACLWCSSGGKIPVGSYLSCSALPKSRLGPGGEVEKVGR